MQTLQTTQQVHGLFRPNRITSKPLLAALEVTDRTPFLPAHLAHLVSIDAPVVLSTGRGLASPLTLAHLLQALNITEGQHVTILAANTGFSTALVSAMVGPSGSVTAVEDTPELLPLLTQNTASLGNVTVINANPATYHAAQGSDVVLLDATVSHLPAQAVGWLNDGATLATLMLQPSGLPAATLYRRHGKALFAEVLFDLKGQTHEIEDSRFTTPQTFVF